MSAVAAWADVAPGAEPSFPFEIRPLLAKNCFSCHGPDEAHREAELRLDDPQSPLDMGAIVPGDPDASEIIRRITTDDPAERMPPPATGRTLSEAQIASFRQWITAGAPYTRHWSYEAPLRRELPSVFNAAWARNAVDYFVLARLDGASMKPAPEADRARLIRRLSLDLTGLPPTIEEVDAFVADRRLDAYQRLVDRLLASQAYGEHAAQKWLDLVRYADTNGYEKDKRRTIWPYRDWVIDALNADMPFDQFTTEQLAGDLLPEPTRSQLIATAMHRNTMQNEEDGTDDEEFRSLAVIDRVNTTMQVWMGTTMGCCQCHSHKYDPLSHREYFQVFAFFNQTADADRPDGAPTLRVRGARVPVMRELPPDSQRTTHVFERGSFLSPGEAVTASTPAVFPPFPADAPRNRLGLARWLVSRENPLTARVVANRQWEQLFGAGLVQTSEDFGSQGTLPSHPELLDWLAIDLMDHGWSLKHLTKTIVMSATYRQAAQAAAEVRSSDPENRLLARGPRNRLTAEQIRDQALAVAGLLSPKMHGPSVMPPQPPGVWQSVYNDDQWETSAGEDRYRRAIYTFWKRTSPYPAAMALDATSRETCTIRRVMTNTPVAALTLLNDAVYVEAAQGLARRILALNDADAAARATYGFRRVLARAPSAQETARLVALFDHARAHFAAHPDAATAFATNPIGPAPDGAPIDELAAWTLVSNVILNLDETLCH